MLIRLTWTIPTVEATLYLMLQGLKEDMIVPDVAGDHGGPPGVFHGPPVVQEGGADSHDDYWTMTPALPWCPLVASQASPKTFSSDCA